MSLTFVQLQNAVKGTRFNESQRADIKTWLNHRYGWLWASEDWTFKQGTDAVTVTANSSALSGVTSDLEVVKAIFDSTGSRLEYLAPVDFNGLYYGQTSTGTPCHYTIVNGTITVGPTADTTKTDYLLLYTKALTALSADSDIPAMPAAFHLLLVQGAAALGLKQENDPTWQSAEQDFQAGLDVMRGQYLRDDESPGKQWGDGSGWPV